MAAPLEKSDPITSSEPFINATQMEARIVYLREKLAHEELAGEDIDVDEEDELRALADLRDDAKSVAGSWASATLIRDEDFEDYAREYAQDIGLVHSDSGWPCDHLDWAAAAAALTVDYGEVTFLGVTYWVRK